MVRGEEVRDQALKEEHFARGGDEGGVGGCGVIKRPVEVVRAVAHKAELHDGVLEFLVGNLFLCERWLVWGGLGSVYYEARLTGKSDGLGPLKLLQFFLVQLLTFAAHL